MPAEQKALAAPPSLRESVVQKDGKEPALRKLQGRFLHITGEISPKESIVQVY